MAVTKRLRFEILRRDNHTCRYCGATAPEATLTVDHVVAVALGGTDDPTNLVAACTDCNSGKSATPAGPALVADVAQDAMRWAQAMTLATEKALLNRDELMAVTRDVLDVLDFAAGFLPVNADDSIDRFLSSGLAAIEIRDAAYSALGAKHIPAGSIWKYFCGICWRKIERRRDEAAQIIEAEQQSIAPPIRSVEDMYAHEILIGTCLTAVCDSRVINEFLGDQA